MTTPATCPTCHQEIKAPTVYDRLRHYRGTMSQADAAILAHVSRVTWTRIEAGTKTEWPQFWAVLSLAGIDREEAMVAWAEARPQKPDPDAISATTETRVPELGKPGPGLLADPDMLAATGKVATPAKKPAWQTITETARAIKAREEAREAAEKAGQT